MEGRSTSGLPLTLRELLAQQELGLKLVTAETEVLDREIAGAHALEVSNPTMWLQDDWVMLTSGMRLTTREEQKALVRELTDAKIAALGFAEEAYFKHIPRSIVEEANAVGLPVFTVPLPTPFREIISFVSQARVSRDIYILRRAFSMQRYLMEALQDREPEAGLVRRLSSVLESSVAIFLPSGQLVASAGRAPLSSVWAGVASGEAALQKFEVGRWSVMSMPVGPPSEPVYWLAVATRDKAVFDQLARTVIEASARLLAVVALSHRAARAEQRILKASLLIEMLDRRFTIATTGVRERLNAHGLVDCTRMRALVILPAERLAGELGPLSDVVVRWIEHKRHAALVAVEADAVVILVSGIDDALAMAQGLYEALREAEYPARLGLSGNIGRDEPVLHAVRDARFAADTALYRLDLGPVVGIDDLDVVGVTLSLDGQDRLEAKARDLLEPLVDNAQLIESLRTYFSAGLDVSKAANRLHLHPNSLRYRLARIEELLGLNLSQPSSIANVYIALRALPETDSQTTP